MSPAISDEALRLAVERAIITADQADGLRMVERQIAEAVAPEPVDDEKLRFITGFADIFVTIGIVLFLGALALLVGRGSGPAMTSASVAACAWVLAEFFTRRRRMALPSIVLLLAFCGAVFTLVAFAIGSATGSPSAEAHGVPFPGLRADLVVPLGVAALGTAGAAAVHYWRFRVPITIAAGAASLCVLVVAIAAASVPDLTEVQTNGLILLCGLAVFVLAMRFDMSDPARETRRTDVAFWLHMLAAPLIVHPLIRGVLHGLDDRMTTGAALGILGVFLALGVVAVIIDRRAILVSGLAYAGIAFGRIIRSLGVTNADLALPTVLLALGAFILLLSAGWQPLRRAFLLRLPGALSRRLPHPLVRSHT